MQLHSVYNIYHIWDIKKENTTRKCLFKNRIKTFLILNFSKESSRITVTGCLLVIKLLWMNKKNTTSLVRWFYMQIDYRILCAHSDVMCCCHLVFNNIRQIRTSDNVYNTGTTTTTTTTSTSLLLILIYLFSLVLLYKHYLCSLFICLRWN